MPHTGPPEISQAQWAEIQRLMPSIPEADIAACGWLKVGNGYFGPYVVVEGGGIEILFWEHPSFRPSSDLFLATVAPEVPEPSKPLSPLCPKQLNLF
jgi:hypothetical protein